MLMTERINEAIRGDYKGIDGLIAIAYYIGRHNGAKTVCDKHTAIIAAMRQRANKCRYHKMANAVIGPRQGTAYDIIYDPDYSTDFLDWTVEEIIEGE